jgi:hypothetical protein
VVVKPGEQIPDQTAVLRTDFCRRIKYAKSHYFAKFCDEGCPCYTPEHTMEISGGQEKPDLDFVNPEFLALPDEALMNILNFCTPSAFSLIRSTCRFLYHLSAHSSFSSFHTIAARERRRQKTHHLPSTSGTDTDPRVMAVTKILDNLIDRAPSFAHELHTCYNESINASRTRDLPKSTAFSSTYAPRSYLSTLRTNLGAGKSQEHIFSALSLPVQGLQHHHWERIDQRASDDRKRKASKEFKAKELDRTKKQRQVREQEIRASKQLGDYYFQAHQKTILLPATVRHHSIHESHG